MVAYPPDYSAKRLSDLLQIGRLGANPSAMLHWCW
jgi:hypothetical protein